MTKQYRFEEITHCEMCGSPSANHSVMGQRLNRTQGMRPNRKTGISVSVMRCTTCDLFYSQPQPVPFNIQDHYGVPVESYWRPEYFTWSPAYFRSELDILRTLQDIRPGMRALDIGAGIGKSMISMSKAGFDVYGFEPSDTFRQKAIEHMNIDPERLRHGMVEDMEYEPESFDFISFGAVFEHLYHPADSLAKAMKWLKPGGIVQIEVPSSRHLIARLINLYYKLIGTNYVTSLSPMHSPFHLYEFDRKSFVELGRRLGFTIVRHDYSVCDIYFFPKWLHPLLRSIMQRTDTGMQLTMWLQKTK